MCSPRNKLSNKTTLSSLNAFSCQKQIIKVMLKVLYFSQNFENYSVNFHDRTMAMAVMDRVSSEGFRG